MARPSKKNPKESTNLKLDRAIKSAAKEYVAAGADYNSLSDLVEKLLRRHMKRQPSPEVPIVQEQLRSARQDLSASAPLIGQADEPADEESRDA